MTHLNRKVNRYMNRNNVLNNPKEENSVIESSAKKLTYNEELKLVAERFDMTDDQTLEFVIHVIYKSKCLSLGLVKALELLENYDEDNDAVNVKMKPIEKILSNLYETIGILETIEEKPPF